MRSCANGSFPCARIYNHIPWPQGALSAITIRARSSIRHFHPHPHPLPSRTISLRYNRLPFHHAALSSPFPTQPCPGERCVSAVLRTVDTATRATERREHLNVHLNGYILSQYAKAADTSTRATERREDLNVHLSGFSPFQYIKAADTTSRATEKQAYSSLYPNG